jgi:hypothetical protein
MKDEIKQQRMNTLSLLLQQATISVDQERLDHTCHHNTNFAL